MGEEGMAGTAPALGCVMVLLARNSAPDIVDVTFRKSRHSPCHSTEDIFVNLTLLEHAAVPVVPETLLRA